jgi:CheY-like chemotaxis protein
MSSILVVDDERLNRMALRKMLQAGGHDVTEAENGQQALSCLEHHQVDVVVTDIIMPEKNGLETISEIRRKYPNIRIIAVSGGARPYGPGALNAAETLGANGSLAKPFGQKEILDLVDQLLQSK